MHLAKQPVRPGWQTSVHSTPACPWRCFGRPAVADGPAKAPWVLRASPSSEDSSGTTPNNSSSSNPWGAGWAKSAKPPSRKGRASSRAGAPVRRPSDRQQQFTPPPREQQDDTEIDPELEAAIRANVDRAAALLDEIIKDINRRMFMTEATAFLYDEEPEMKMSQAIRAAISSRLDVLDGNFLAALNAYATAAKQLEDSPLPQLLAALRTEVLNQVSQQMPPAVRVLNAALAHASRTKRRDILKVALGDAPTATTSSSSSSGSSSSSRTATKEAATAAGSGGDGDVPTVGLEALSAAAIQLVDDMEDQELIADRVLLARLVLLREELRATAAKKAVADMLSSAAPSTSAAPEDSSSSSSDIPSTSGRNEAGRPDPAYRAAADGGFFSYQRANLPKQCAAFLKELLGVGDRARRVALINKAFAEDWDPAGLKGAEQQEGEAPDVLRPGRFLSTLHATRKELEQAYVAGTLGGASSSESEDGGAGLLKRMDEIELECLVVLDKMQQGAGDKGLGQTDLHEQGGIDYVYK